MGKRTTRIFMVSESVVSGDSRLVKEIGTLEKDHQIVVLGLKGKKEKSFKRVGNVRYLRIPSLPGNSLGKFYYPFQYTYITLASILFFLFLLPVYRFKIIHVHNPPDTYFALGLVGKIFGVRFIYDLHDLSPELYLSRFAKQKGFIYSALETFEKISCKIADRVITTNESYKAIIKNRHNLPDEKVVIVRNDPILQEFQVDFQEAEKYKIKGKILILYIGAINPQDGVEFLVDISRRISEKGYPPFLFRIIGAGDSFSRVKEYVEKMGMEEYFEFTGMIRDRKQIMAQLASADICVEPAPPSPVNNHSTFIKVMEYMGSGKAFVAYDLKETRYSSNGAGLLVPPGDKEKFIEALEELLRNEDLRKKLGETGAGNIKDRFNWKIASENLENVYREIEEKPGTFQAAN